MSCFSAGNSRDESIDDVLQNARRILDLGKDALELSPVPGLKIAAGALSTVIEMIQVGHIAELISLQS